LSKFIIPKTALCEQLSYSASAFVVSFYLHCFLIHQPSVLEEEDLNTRIQSKSPKRFDPSLVQLKIYPNPFTADIRIELKEVPGHGVLFNLYDQAGKIRQEKIGTARTNLSLNNLSTGVYTCQLVNENGKLIGTGKLVKPQ
jgi:hypothetical protein